MKLRQALCDVMRRKIDMCCYRETSRKTREACCKTLAKLGRKFEMNCKECLVRLAPSRTMTLYGSVVSSLLSHFTAGGTGAGRRESHTSAHRTRNVRIVGN